METAKLFLSSNPLTENGYTTDFELELLLEAEDCYAAVANGAKTYSSAAELRAALDSEEDHVSIRSCSVTTTSVSCIEASANCSNQNAQASSLGKLT